MRLLAKNAVIAICVISLFPASAQGCANSALRLGASASLPDCRAYEQVSPAAKNGVDAFSPNFPLPAEVPVTETSEGGVSSFAYQSLDPTTESGSDFVGNVYRATRGAREWQTENLTPSTSGPIPTGALATFSSFDFSPNLSSMVVSLAWQKLAPETPPLLINLFLRDSTGHYSLITTALPKVPVPESCLLCFQERDIPVFAGASSDYGHVIFEADESLVSNALGGGVASLYESYEGHAGLPREVRLVGILPDGAIPVEGSIESSIPGASSMPGAGLEDNSNSHYNSGGLRSASYNINHAISLDGSRIIFSATADSGLPDPTQAGTVQIYDRLAGHETVEISAPAKGATPTNPTAEPAQFWGASADGSLIYFTSSAELTTASNTGAANASQDLYRYEVSTGTLTDLTVDTEPAEEGAGVKGVVRVSEDGSYVYFVATGKLAKEAKDGQPNLYVSHEGAPPQFIATLNAAADSLDWTPKPVLSDTYLTPDGRHLAFMSIESLTGYNNVDINTNQRDSEVYEYSAEHGTLQCASCASDGARPAGGAFIGTTEILGTAFYHPRVLSNDGGRLFFWSSNPLVGGEPVDHTRVYEFEQGGIGSCVQSNGCLYSISSSASTADDVFLDASPSGNDVFFATYGQLVSADQDNLMDIYDARVNGGFLQEVPSPPPCNPCQQTINQRPSFGQSPSEAISGNGNVVSLNSTHSTRRTSIRTSHTCPRRKHGHGTTQNRCKTKINRKHEHVGRRRASK